MAKMFFVGPDGVFCLQYLKWLLKDTVLMWFPDHKTYHVMWKKLWTTGRPKFGVTFYYSPFSEAQTEMQFCITAVERRLPDKKETKKHHVFSCQCRKI